MIALTDTFSTDIFFKVRLLLSEKKYYYSHAQPARILSKTKRGHCAGLVFVKTQEYGRAAIQRYRKFNIYQKVRPHPLLNILKLYMIYCQLFVWGTICLYIALGTFFIVVGADRIGQALYDFAQKISHFQFGWLILIALFCESNYMSNSPGP